MKTYHTVYVLWSKFIFGFEISKSALVNFFLLSSKIHEHDQRN